MTAPLQPAFRALADPTRRDILHRLSAREMTIAEITEHCAMTRAAVKKHLTVLQDGDLIRMRRQGRETYSRLNAAALRPVVDWLGFFETFWDDRLDALHATLSQKEPDQ
ncbi:metalloregulator ArsR/SmtB family transcription factor [Thalassococcus sp. CAU 1522]|uniref:Metalloregulator ArsR/SmtB family transcription factor n=1 Tax=Thalassococcus arenae TaxID=2851652 RepID=A0ABS6N8S0_9RHOB|nr:metalloregulator ArsR/SmtB family transcription factor [Thalassococcus arenae]MBV2360410.1 metalloregulator ArsR/SmtB family transcription factor [Thalassococcus arenae]